MVLVCVPSYIVRPGQGVCMVLVCVPSYIVSPGQGVCMVLVCVPSYIVRPGQGALVRAMRDLYCIYCIKHTSFV